MAGPAAVNSCRPTLNHPTRSPSRRISSRASWGETSNARMILSLASKRSFTGCPCMRIFPPAKINLTLEVLGKRSDGFHELASWMIPIALYDCLTIEPAAKMVFESNVPELQSNRTNLIIRAVEAFQKLSGNPQDYRIV